MIQRIRVLFAASLAACLACACMTRPAEPVVERTALPSSAATSAASASSAAPARSDGRPQTYTVKTGDTLAKIALDHGLDYRELATWNGIDNPNVIRVGQVLLLGPPGQGGPSPLRQAVR